MLPACENAVSSISIGGQHALSIYLRQHHVTLLLAYPICMDFMGYRGLYLYLIQIQACWQRNHPAAECCAHSMLQGLAS